MSEIPDSPPGHSDSDAGRARLASLFNAAFPWVLVLSILAVYAQVVHFEFINCDDDLYVLNNPHVLAGITLDGIKWAFTALVASNWQPVTLLSHMLDVQLFGLNSAMQHLVNVLFHAISSVLLFALLRRATGAPAPSAFVAFVFALHPLHVESVAWISERKDVLSALFWFLGLYAYVLYAERPAVGRYLLVLGTFCLGVMSKPMLVTFPFTLLLFDIWPLRRWQWPKSVWEKLPLFALTAVACVVTYLAQRGTGAVNQVVPLDGRVANALVSYLGYIVQTFWPLRLAMFYPYPHTIAAWQAGIALAVVLSVSVIFIRMWRTRPYLAVGWFWYLGTLVPVLGLVQVGEQSHADRYTYIPMVGLLVILAWGAADIISQWPRTKPAIAVAAVVSCTACVGLAWAQTRYWQNGETLYEHAIDVTENNTFAQNNLGYYLVQQPGRRLDAMEHFEAALRIQPDSPGAHNNIGATLLGSGLCAAAIPHFEAALRAKPNMAEASNNLGTCQMNGGNYAAATGSFEAALRVNPDFLLAHLNLARALSKTSGRDPEAIAQYEAVLRLNPAHSGAHRELGELLVRLGRTDEAKAHLDAAQPADLN